MEADETGTLARLSSYRDELVDPKITEHHGRIVKLMGDGTLAEFGSVVDAVACAIVTQKGMADFNSEVGEDTRQRLATDRERR